MIQFNCPKCGNKMYSVFAQLPRENGKQRHTMIKRKYCPLCDVTFKITFTEELQSIKESPPKEEN